MEFVIVVEGFKEELRRLCWIEERVRVYGSWDEG
jgi:hypothetical protein